MIRPWQRPERVPSNRWRRTVRFSLLALLAVARLPAPAIAGARTLEEALTAGD